MKRVFTADNISEAGLVRSYLEQHDIPSQLRNEYASGALGDLPFSNSWPEIWVDDSFASHALELVAEIRKQESQQQRVEVKDWLCRDCRESNPGNFELCWQCGKHSGEKSS